MLYQATHSCPPYRSYKQWCYQGGISTPLIIARGKDTPLAHHIGISYQVAHIIDLFPTCIDLASVSYPKKHNAKQDAFTYNKTY